MEKMEKLKKGYFFGAPGRDAQCPKSDTATRKKYGSVYRDIS